MGWIMRNLGGRNSLSGEGLTAMARERLLAGIWEIETTESTMDRAPPVRSSQANGTWGLLAYGCVHGVADAPRA